MDGVVHGRMVMYRGVFLFYFIILPHTMNFKQNKNDNK